MSFSKGLATCLVNESVVIDPSVCVLLQLVMLRIRLEELIIFNIYPPLNTLLHTFLNHRQHRFRPWLWGVLYTQTCVDNNSQK